MDLKTELMGLSPKNRLRPEAVPTIFPSRQVESQQLDDQDQPRMERTERRQRKALVEDIIDMHDRGEEFTHSISMLFIAIT